MNDFEKTISKISQGGLHACGIDTLQVNLGLKCNQQCIHCHLKCGPDRTEMMSWPVMEQILDMLEVCGCRLVDITGGSPELNPHLPEFIEALSRGGGQAFSRAVT